MSPYHSIAPITIKGLSVSYDKKRVLTNIFLEIPAGSICGVVGPNGAGKSTLFKAVLGLIDANSGDVKIHGQEIEDVRSRIAYVPQKDDVDWTFPATVEDIVLMGRYPHKKFYQLLNKMDKQIAVDAMQYYLLILPQA